MIGGIEYHDKKATMQDIHAYIVAKIIRSFISLGPRLNVPDEMLSYEGVEVSAGES